jgi:predicted metal-dependent enzyme (double-stranded beta helix superfamily)
VSASEKLGNVATTLLLENDRVKIWEMRLAPGESSDLHEHTMDYCMCIVEGTSVDADPAEGTPFRLSVTPGDVFYVQRGGVERAVNRSDVRFREILIELKG